jgi:hypothetical protein
VREETGDVMIKLKKTAAVVAMVGGLGLTGSGVASANEYDGPFAVDNLQVVKCEQAFDAGTAFVASPVLPVGGGDVEQNIGNFCSAVNIED